jgi:hypothetical protein
MTDKKHTEQFHKNFIRAVHQVMADKEELNTYNLVAEWLDIGKQSLYKIMNGDQFPTIEQGVTLCKKGRFNANWMFLNTGEMKQEINLLLKEVFKMLKLQYQ